MGFVKFLKFLRLKVRGRRAAERVAAVDIGGEGDVGDEICYKLFKGEGAIVYAWEEIRKFTMDFASVIGYGGFSTVYLAKLSNSSTAAVKIQFRCTQRLNEAYKQELEILLRINHPYIVKLLGYCGEDREEGTLILEHAVNGNLHEKLHSSISSLSWRRRMAIAFQLATAIDYLHQNCIIHCDIKSSNILLDDKLNCKLCDFGSSKMGFASLVVSSNSKSRAAMLGSPGYTDPHYMRTGLASKKSDMYSFGVILLELVSGMEALDPLSGERLTARVGPALRDMEKVVEMFDPRLKSRGDFDWEEAKAVAEVAATCLSDSPAHRPSMSDVLIALRKGVSSISY
ncbi:probable receptor-like protein kinase At1g33260 [Salvia hispanica]|uniref:probable receptor-like protein kinase At1g33260 n=1 Tax=Salvia hispanica TaxID=49212 RepID=UPI002009A051|nr:probable receptor-like protein kinase At1g33260 [Salvia hispanica]